MEQTSDAGRRNSRFPAAPRKGSMGHFIIIGGTTMTTTTNNAVAAATAIGKWFFNCFIGQGTH